MRKFEDFSKLNIRFIQMWIFSKNNKLSEYLITPAKLSVENNLEEYIVFVQF